MWLPTFQLIFASITLPANEHTRIRRIHCAGNSGSTRAAVGLRYICHPGLALFSRECGLQTEPKPCELIHNIPLAIHSLTNYRHIVLFVLFFLMSSAQFRMSQWSGYAWAALACIDGATRGISAGRLRDRALPLARSNSRRGGSIDWRRDCLPLE